MNEVTFPIPTNRLGEFTKNVTKLNKKASRLDFPFVTFTTSAPRVETQRVRNINDEDGTEVKVEVVDVTFDEVSLGFNDYKLIGLTENVEGIDVLHNFTKGLLDLTEERGTCACDHCNTNRRRNKVYFVAKKDESPNFIRVGSTCVQDFFPKDAGNILAKFRFVEDIFEFFRSGCDPFMMTSSHVYSVKDILSLTCRLAREVGFTSATKAREYGTSATRDGVTSILFDPNEKIDATESDIKNAQTILDWFKGNEEVSDYFDNCREIVSKGYCGGKLIGYIVGLYGCWNHANNQRIAAAANTSKHIEKTGKRQTFTGVIKSVRTFEGLYGVGYITTVDCAGDIVVYFNQLKFKDFYCDDLADYVGVEVQFDAAIKEHGEFNNVKQTTVSRATFVQKISGDLVPA